MSKNKTLSLLSAKRREEAEKARNEAAARKKALLEEEQKFGAIEEPVLEDVVDSTIVIEKTVESIPIEEKQSLSAESREDITSKVVNQKTDKELSSPVVRKKKSTYSEDFQKFFDTVEIGVSGRLNFSAYLDHETHDFINDLYASLLKHKKSHRINKWAILVKIVREFKAKYNDDLDSFLK